jgi:hypothetical protein
MWYLWFTLAVAAHIGIAVFCAWRFRHHTAYCTVPGEKAFAQARHFSEAAKSSGQHLTHSDFMVLATTTHERWSTPPWVGIYFLAGLVVLAGGLLVHVIRPDVI